MLGVFTGSGESARGRDELSESSVSVVSAVGLLIVQNFVGYLGLHVAEKSVDVVFLHGGVVCVLETVGNVQGDGADIQVESLGDEWEVIGRAVGLVSSTVACIPISYDIIVAIFNVFAELPSLISPCSWWNIIITFWMSAFAHDRWCILGEPESVELDSFHEVEESCRPGVLGIWVEPVQENSLGSCDGLGLEIICTVFQQWGGIGEMT